MFERSIDQFTFAGVYIETFKNATYACKVIGRGLPTNISACCRGHRKSAFGYIWKYTPQPDLEGEVWKPHPTLNIKLSSHGRLENSKGRRTFGSQAKNGYKNYMEKGKSYGIHRLVYETFNFGADFEVVHHLNRIRNDNRLENLQGCTQKENIQAYHDLIPKLY